MLAVRNHGDHNTAACTFHWRQLQSTDVTSQQPSGCIDHHVTWGYLRYHLQTCCQACHTGWHHHMTKPKDITSKNAETLCAHFVHHNQSQRLMTAVRAQALHLFCLRNH